MLSLRNALMFAASTAFGLAAIGCAGSGNPVAPSRSAEAGQQLAVAEASTGAASIAAQGDCPNDSKLLGLFEVSTDYRPGTWWFLSKNSLVQAGFTTDAAQELKLEQISGTQYAGLAAAVEALVEGARSWDKNGNGWVCAFELRGTHAYLNEPLVNDIFFGISDDRLTKK